MAGPLDGVKVLDVSQAAAGPIAAELLAELGAEVIKVEPPWGDFVRNTTPYKNGVDLRVFGFSRSKRGIVLDLKNEKDRQLITELVKWADVFLENYKVGTADKMGLGYDALREINPRIIYTSAAGYGHKGPLREQGTWGNIAVMFAGWGSISGHPGGRGEYPRGGLGADPVSPTYLTLAILMALYHRETTGHGQLIESSQIETSIAFQQTHASYYFATGEHPPLMGSASLNVVPSQAFATADGYVVVDAPTDRTWRRLCEALDASDLASDSRFTTNPLRVTNRAALVPCLEAIFEQKQSSEWIAILQAHAVPCALIARTLDDIYADPQVQANHLIFEMEHPRAGLLKTSAVPWEFSKTPVAVKSLGPTLGEHSREIRREFGFPEEDEREMAESRAARLSAR